MNLIKWLLGWHRLTSRMASLQNYFQEIVTCTATLKFRVQMIQKVGSSTEIKVRLNVQCCPTLDERENIKLINKNAKIYSVPGSKTKTFYRTVTRTPKHKKLQSRLLNPLRPHFNVGKPFWGTDNALTNVVLYLSR